MPARIYKAVIYLFLLTFLLPFFACAQSVLININTAGVEELDTLDGIGPAYAQRIIDYRNSNGPFAKIEDIKNVSGIGDATFSKIKDSITVDSVEAEKASAASIQTSAHYSASPASSPTSNPPEKIELSAGRDRVGAVGSPIEFRVETNISYSRQNIFSWNFGDGTLGGGPVLSHVYDYPGEYAVVLAAFFNDREVISRLNVRIIDPKLSIKLVSPERIEIENNSGQEVNLFGRALISGRKIFAFPKDTIIKSGQSISFSSRVTGLAPNNLSEISLLVVGENRDQFKILASLEERREKAAAIQNQIAFLEQTLASISRPAAPVNSVVQKPPAPVVEAQPALALNAVSDIEKDKGGEVERGWWYNLKRFFLRTK
jgi:competence ComEA-like helix-hairpin-helix protein